jgi:hypothetical protein
MRVFFWKKIMTVENITKHILLDSVSATGAGNKVPLIKKGDSSATFQATANGTSGDVTATADIEVSNNETDWISMATISLSASAPVADSDGFASNASWAFVRANLTAITGIDARVTVVMGV